LYAILDDEALSGARAVSRRLRAHRHARLLDNQDYGAAVGLIGRLCQSWGGVADLLVPVSPGGPVPEPYDALLSHSEIDSLTGTPELAPAAAPWGGLAAAAEFPVHPIAASRPRDTYAQVTVTAVAVDDPWHLSYAGCLGLLPQDPDRGFLERAFVNPDLKVEDVMPVERQQPDQPGLDDLMQRLSKPAAVHVSLLALPPRPLKNSIYATDGWFAERSALARQRGTGIVVVYRPGNVSDLCLLWNLRALHGWAGGLPVGLPWPEDDLDAPDALAGQLRDLSARFQIQTGALPGGPVLVSQSIPPDLVESLADQANEQQHLQAEWALPGQLLVPANAPARTTGETVTFTNGQALVATRSERDHRWLEVADRLPVRPPLQLSVALHGGPLPTGKTLRGDQFLGPRYLGGA
jgi:hypothetical protein